MDLLHHVDVRLVEFVAGHFVRVAPVVSAHLDEHQVGGLLGRVVEGGRVVAVELVGTGSGVGGTVPPPGLTSVNSLILGTACSSKIGGIPFRGRHRRSIACQPGRHRGKPRLVG